MITYGLMLSTKTAKNTKRPLLVCGSKRFCIGGRYLLANYKILFIVSFFLMISLVAQKLGTSTELTTSFNELRLSYEKLINLQHPSF